MQLAEFNIFVFNLIGFVQIQKIGHDSIQKLNKDNIRTFLSIVLISSSSGASAYETLPLTRWGYVRGVLDEFESAMMHSVTKKIIWGPPRRAMKIRPPSIDTNIMNTSLDEGYLYSLTLRNQKLKCILI